MFATFCQHLVEDLTLSPVAVYPLGQSSQIAFHCMGSRLQAESSSGEELWTEWVVKIEASPLPHMHTGIPLAIAAETAFLKIS